MTNISSVSKASERSTGAPSVIANIGKGNTVLGMQPGGDLEELPPGVAGAQQVDDGVVDFP
jgi:hypothetical protein